MSIEEIDSVSIVGVGSDGRVLAPFRRVVEKEKPPSRLASRRRFDSGFRLCPSRGLWNSGGLVFGRVGGLGTAHAEEWPATAETALELFGLSVRIGRLGALGFARRRKTPA